MKVEELFTMKKCTECSSICCKFQISIFFDEFESFFIEGFDFNIIANYDLIKIIENCPFCKDNLCIIYENRPIACRQFPSLMDSNSNKFFFALHPRCPYCEELSKNYSNPNQITDFLGISDEERANFVLDTLKFKAKNFIVDELLPLKIKNKKAIKEKIDSQKYGRHDVPIYFTLSKEEYKKYYQKIVISLLQDKFFKNAIPTAYKKKFEEFISRFDPELFNHF